MVFLEHGARAVLILHAVLGAAVVAVTTHLVVWIRRYPRGEFGRHRAARLFATVGLILYATQFTLGNLLYPVYKVRVRSEYLDLPQAVAAEGRGRQEAREMIQGADAPTVELPRSLRYVGHLFDVKEHWVALGLALSIGVCLLAWAWDPRRDGPGATSLFVGLAVGQALCAWLAGIVGIFVTAIRAIGG